MTDRDALLSAILADPADDTVRLAYADWVEEHETAVRTVKCPFCEFGRCFDKTLQQHYRCGRCGGEGGWGESGVTRADFVRTQVECDRLWRTWKWSGWIDPADANFTRWVYLGKYGQRALDTFGELWKKDVCVALSGRQWRRPYSNIAFTFVRGFVGEMTLWVEEWWSFGARLLRLLPVTKVTLLGAWPLLLKVSTGRYPKTQFIGKEK